jgi:hypothetical protein
MSRRLVCIDELERELRQDEVALMVLASLPLRYSDKKRASDIAEELRLDLFDVDEHDVRLAAKRLCKMGIYVTCSRSHGIMRCDWTDDQINMIDWLYKEWRENHDYDEPF